ncbi:MAG: chromosome segregation protein SMC [Rhizobiaceae bacterium]|nr:chromosome segregation protein SMC [Rhizobiaceae bacterium]
MFAQSKLSLTVPSGSKEPRLWVRRLVIWEAPGGEKLRDVWLRPGLNIIWSPDGLEDRQLPGSTRSIGHGSGKTLFCRLIRYCLGEQRFADEVQRERIAIAFPNGIVGAEVILDGVCWAILRPLGLRRRHVAVPDGNLDEIAAGDGTATSIDPLIDAIEQSILTPSAASLARLQPGQKAWPIALTWLTRDQECRFDDVLDWRSPASGSDAPLPASGREVGPRREALRAFMMAITEAEQETRREEEKTRVALTEAERTLAHLDWDIGRRMKRLVGQLDLPGDTFPDMPLLQDVFKRASGERLSAAASLPRGDVAELAEARRLLHEAREEFLRDDEERVRIETQLPLASQVLTLLNSEVPGLSFAVGNAGSQVCPICEVPIDRILATQCGLSHKLHDEAQCRARLEAARQAVTDQQAAIGELTDRLKKLQPVLALVRQRLERAEHRVRSIETVNDTRSSSWRAATRLQEDVDRFAELLGEREDVKKSLRRLEVKLTAERDRLAAFRDKQAVTFARISEKFAGIIRHLLAEEAKGTVVLTGTGLDISVDLDGDRRTAAIESLKVLAFDLACLCLSAEGATRVPAFLIHDSPREADLSLIIYDELFSLVRELEQATETPSFQYIVTTTTPPPEGFQEKPWLIESLRGAPASERLMRRDL